MIFITIFLLIIWALVLNSVITNVTNMTKLKNTYNLEIIEDMSLRFDRINYRRDYIIFNTYNTKEEIPNNLSENVNTLPYVSEVENRSSNNIDDTNISNMPEYNIILDIELQKYIWDKCESDNWDYETMLGLFKLESGFDSTLICRNSDNSYDIGIAQINSKYTKWYGEELAGHTNFDPLNPYHSIDACFAGLNCYRKYWENEGIPSKDILYYTLNSYNMGTAGFLSYVKKTGAISRSYDRVITKNKKQLLENGAFIE